MSEESNAPAKRGVGTLIREQLLAGATNDAALEAVKAEFPESSTTKATVSWYRNELRRKGEKVPTAAEAKRAAQPAGEQEPADPLD